MVETNNRRFLNYMNLTTLRIFCDVVLHQSFSRGAAANEVSQSAATQSIHRMEKHLGAKLIDRGKRPFVLTPEGKICYESFREILETYDNLITLVKTPHDNIRGQIRVAAIYSVGLNEMSRCMKEFMRTYPKSKIRLEYMHPDRIYQAVLNSEIDLGIVSYPSASQEIDVIPLRMEKTVLVCPPGHSLTAKEKVSPQELENMDFIAFDRSLLIRKEIDRFFRQYEVRVNTVMEFDNIETIKQAVETGLGVAILPAPTIGKEVDSGKLAAVPMQPESPTRPIGIIHRTRKIFTIPALKFIEMLSERIDIPKNGLESGDEERT